MLVMGRVRHAAIVASPMSGSDGDCERQVWGHEDLFRPPRLSAGYRLGKPTFAGTQGNGQDAPRAALALLRIS
jgi:hypothetical protein